MGLIFQAVSSSVKWQITLVFRISPARTESIAPSNHRPAWPQQVRPEDTTVMCRVLSRPDETVGVGKRLHQQRPIHVLRDAARGSARSCNCLSLPLSASRHWCRTYWTTVQTMSRQRRSRTSGRRCFSCACTIVLLPCFFGSLEPAEALLLSDTCMSARDVLCGPRAHQAALGSLLIASARARLCQA